MPQKLYMFFCVVAFSTQFVLAQDFYHEEKRHVSLKDRTWGFGGNAAVAPFGISIQRCIGEEYSIQGVFGYIAFSDFYFSNVGVRGKYRFEQRENAEPYIFAATSITSIGNRSTNVSETIPSYSVGAGFDYNHDIAKNVINSYEVGFLHMKAHKTDIAFSALYYSFSVHYYFSR